MTEKSAQEKLAELDQRDSNAETVESIATTGHIASTGIMAVSMVEQRQRWDWQPPQQIPVQPE
ncbi:hypothetical protein ACVXG8_12540 [Escherichia coli]